MKSLVWFPLVTLATVWGFISGACFAGSPVMDWLDPASALFGMLGLQVIGLSLVVAEVSRKRSVSDTRSPEG